MPGGAPIDLTDQVGDPRHLREPRRPGADALGVPHVGELRQPIAGLAVHRAERVVDEVRRRALEDRVVGPARQQVLVRDAATVVMASSLPCPKSRQTFSADRGRMAVMHEDHDRCYRAVASRDSRFDGRFVTAVTTTGIYCRPSCPAQTPKRENVTLLPVRGRRGGRRLPRLQALPPRGGPGSREWDVRGDLAARALRAIAAGAIDGDGRRPGAGRVAARQRASPAPRARRRGRRRSARARPHPPGADRPAAARRDRPADVARSRSRPGSPASGSSTTRCASTSAMTPRELRRRPHQRRREHRRADAAARRTARRTPRRRDARRGCGCHLVAGIQELDGTTYRRVLPSGAVGVAADRRRRRIAADDPHRRRPDAARHRRPLPPDARRRRRPARGRRDAVRGPGARAAGRGPAGAPRAGRGRRLRAAGPHRARPAGVARGGPHVRARGSSRRTASRSTRPTAR